MYNLTYNPPKKPGYDDITGEKLCKREDDEEEVVRKRLMKFRELTGPLLDFYDGKQVLVQVKGEESDRIYPFIQREIASRLYRI